MVSRGGGLIGPRPDGAPGWRSVCGWGRSSGEVLAHFRPATAGDAPGELEVAQTALGIEGRKQRPDRPSPLPLPTAHRAGGRSHGMWLGYAGWAPATPAPARDNAASGGVQ